MVMIATPASAPELCVPPHSIEAEQAVIGGLLLSPTAFDRIDFLRPGQFYADQHRAIARVLWRMIEDGRAVDPLLLIERLRAAGELERAGDAAYIRSLAINTPSAANIRRYAEIVRDKAMLRELQATATDIYDKAATPGADAQALQEEAESRLFAARTARGGGDMETLGDALTRAVERVDRLYSSGGGIAGIETGLIDLDHMTGGLESGDLIVIGARPSMGKTALALGILEHVASKAGPCALFSMEMSSEQIGLREIAANARVSMHNLRTGRVQGDDWTRIGEAIGKLSNLPLMIDDRPGVTLGYIRARLRRLCRKHGSPRLIAVDYMTLMNGQGESRDERVGGIAKGLKEIAKEFSAPVIALAQLNRNLEMRTDRRPTMADLRESGEIEQAADLIILLYRDQVYFPESEYKGIAELHIAKQRNGPTGTIYTTFLDAAMRFTNLAGALPSIPMRSRPRAAGVVTAPDFKRAAAGDA
ncbi:MAG: replicative DNA helicase [Pseudomonadota bacterium]